jgi:plasmid stabilization system protein ParE
VTFRVRFTSEAEEDLVRLYRIILEREVTDWALAERALETMRHAVAGLEQSPFSHRKAGIGGSPFLGQLVIPFGSAGYVALFDIEGSDDVTILAVRHLRVTPHVILPDAIRAIATGRRAAVACEWISRLLPLLTTSSMGYLVFQPGGAPPAPAEAWPEGGQRWSEAATWGGAVPGATSAVVIEAGRTIVLDCDAEVASLDVRGTLLVAAGERRLTAGWIAVQGGGRFAAGSPEAPLAGRLTITLAACAVAPHPQLGTKFLAALDGGTLDLHGTARTSWVALGVSVAPGHATVRLAQPVDWRAGERIAIASGQDHALLEERTIVAVGPDCLTLTLDRALAHRHHGEQATLRHVLPGSLAKAVLLERNIVVQGCADSERASVGGFCMVAASPTVGVAARRAVGRFSGVEFRRMGQFNRPGRYPLHWHNNGDAVESSVVGCLVHASYQRGIVTVGSRHVRISGNVVLKPFGHGYIVESEDNSPQLVTSNLAVRPRVARFADASMRSYCEVRPRAFWIVRSQPAPTAAPPAR